MSKGNPFDLVQSGSLSLFSSELAKLHKDVMDEMNRSRGLQSEIKVHGEYDIPNKEIILTVNGWTKWSICLLTTGGYRGANEVAFWLNDNFHSFNTRLVS